MLRFVRMKNLEDFLINQEKILIVIILATLLVDIVQLKINKKMYMKN
jgi:hypothetical protein